MAGAGHHGADRGAAAGRGEAAGVGVPAGVLGAVAGPVAIVSNEVGSGIIPANALARRYADELGTLNQRVAEVVDRVVLMVAGMPLLLKPVQKQNEVVL